MSERIVVLDNFTSSGVAATRHFCNINSVAAAVLCAVQVWRFLPVQWKSSGSQRGSTTQEMPTGTLSPWSTLICRYSNSTHDLLDMWVGFCFGFFLPQRKSELVCGECFISVAASFFLSSCSMLVIVSGLWLGTAEPWWPHVPNVWWKNHLLPRPGHRLSHFY